MPKPAFGIFDSTMIGKLKRLLKPYSLEMKVKADPKNWGDQVEVRIVPLERSLDSPEELKYVMEDVATRVLFHIDEMYPGMWEGVPKIARLSVRNTIIGQGTLLVQQALQKPGALVAVRTDDGVSIHAEHSNGTYDTLCGIDADDPKIGHFGVVDLPAKAKMDCQACIDTIRKAYEYPQPIQAREETADDWCSSCYGKNPQMKDCHKCKGTGTNPERKVRLVSKA